MSKPSSNPTRTWPVRVIALLLLVQAIGLVGLNVYNIALQANLEQNFDTFLNASDEEMDNLPSEVDQLLEVIVIAALLAPLAVPAVLAAVGFVFLWRWGWMLAMMTQVLILLVCLMLYLEIKPPLVYPLMVYGILMVLYLNVQDVRLAFFTKHIKEQEA